VLDLSLIIKLAKLWLTYLLLALLFAVYYRKYIRSGVTLWKLFLIVSSFVVSLSFALCIICIHIICMRVFTIARTIILLVPTIVVIHTDNELRAIVYHIVVILIAFITYYITYYIRTKSYRCKKEEEREMDGIKFVLCHTDIINAWCSWNNKIYVSKALAEHLTDNELRAVVYHEEGHARNKWIGCIPKIWAFALADIMVVQTILVILIILRVIPLSAEEFLIVINVMYWLAAILTLCAMVPSWIAEHEFDIRALEKVGFNSAINALIKVGIYRTLEKAELVGVVSDCEIKNIIVNHQEKYKVDSFAMLYRTLITYGLAFPKWIWEYVKKPTYYEHPPPELRIGLLIRRATTVKERA